MELRTLKYLMSLSETGSITAAAKKNFVTQPAVSIQLRKLEEELGTKLFEYRGRIISFTPSGKLALEYADKFLKLESELYDEINDLSGLRKGVVSLGTIDAAGIYVMPQIFSTFRELYPAIDVHLEIASTRPLLDDLREGSIDMVVGTLSGEEKTFDIYPFYNEELVLIAPPSHPLAGRKSVDFKSLSDFPFISYHNESVTRGIVEKFFNRHGIQLRITMAIGNPEAIKKLVASGLGMAVLPERLVETELREGSISRLYVEGMKLERKLGLFIMKKHYLPVAARAFLGVMKDGLLIDIPGEYCLCD